jgi:hypothetical protein
VLSVPDDPKNDDQPLFHLQIGVDVAHLDRHAETIVGAHGLGRLNQAQVTVVRAQVYATALSNVVGPKGVLAITTAGIQGRIEDNVQVASGDWTTPEMAYWREQAWGWGSPSGGAWALACP